LNTFGGSKAKGQARKFANTSKQIKALRLASSDDDSEIYAQVTKYCGNGMCHVLCIDGKTRLCHIRGKFRGRGKKDNMVLNGSWVLVGLRDWESEKKIGDKLENCDLLEVYNDHDKERLKTSEKINWSLFINNDNKFSMASDEASNSFEFADEMTSEYTDIMEKTINEKNKNTINIINNENDIVDVDDI
jgi:translation initiation factor 1A